MIIYLQFFGGRGASSSGGGAGGGGTPIAITSSQSTYIPGGTFGIMSDQDANDLRDLEDSQYDANTTAAIKMYISNTDYDRKGHSISQTLNYKLENGQDISSDSTLAYTDAFMHNAMHDIGKNTRLQRGAHDDIIKQLGVNDYTKMSEQQLQQKLVGQSSSFKGYVSTSYDVNKNPFLSAKSGSGVSGGREIELNINAQSGTKCVFGAKKQSEIVLDKGTNFVVTGVRYKKSASGKQQYATPRNGGQKPILVVDIQTW